MVTNYQVMSFLAKYVLRLDTSLFLLCVGFFILYPDFDIYIVSYFYDETTAFYIDQWLGVEVVYRFFAYVQFPILIGLIYGIVKFGKTGNRRRKRHCIYLLCCLLIGPGILVNIVLKDNSLGRPRPKHIENFGGQHQYAKPFEYSGVCRKNCSFTSGHAAIGFIFMALYWVYRRRSVFVAGATLGLLLGFMRIAQGGHFPSDVVFSFWAVYFTALWLASNFKLLNNAAVSTRTQI